MGSDIYTESAVAIKLKDFLNRKELKKKSVRNDIVDELIKVGFISAVDDHLEMRESVSNFIEYFHFCSILFNKIFSKIFGSLM